MSYGQILWIPQEPRWLHPVYGHLPLCVTGVSGKAALYVSHHYKLASLKSNSDLQVQST